MHLINDVIFKIISMSFETVFILTEKMKGKQYIFTNEVIVWKYEFVWFVNVSIHTWYKSILTNGDEAIHFDK